MGAELETKPVLKKLVLAHRYLAELKGVVATIPNESILLNTLSLQEAQDSSAIENIITTQDEVFKAQLFDEAFAINPAAKEVSQYAAALRTGVELVQKTGVITSNHIVKIQQVLEQNTAQFRKLPGTALKNSRTGETVYMPPQEHSDILSLMHNLEAYINEDALCPLDPLVKMALIHHQFESIHPFYDGNGRTGRIICILYLFKQELLQVPVLYLSRYIIQNKDEYYRQLQRVRDTGNYEPWLLYMLEGVEQTAMQTIQTVKNIKTLMMDYKTRIRKDLPKIYSQELLNNLFRHPYTKIEYMEKDIGKTRITATKYLDTLTDYGFLEKQRIGKYNYYINEPLMHILAASPKVNR